MSISSLLSLLSLWNEVTNTRVLLVIVETNVYCVVSSVEWAIWMPVISHGWTVVHGRVHTVRMFLLCSTVLIMPLVGFKET